MSGIIGNLLKQYEDQEFVIRLKARFIAQCYIVELAVILVAILYTGYANLHNPIYEFKLHFLILGVLTGGFALSILGLVILVRGYYTISANLLILIGFATVWTVIFTDQTHVVARLDTIVFVIGLLCMMPIVILERPYGMVFYAGINILVLYGFMFLMRDDLNLPYASFISYLADNTVTILVVATISYQISVINRRALEQVERDIVVRKRAEAAREEALQRYQALFKSKTTLVFVTDDQGRFVEANDLALDLFGYDKKELRRLDYFQLLHPDQDPEQIAMTVLEILETGAQVEPLEIKLRSKNGKTIYVQTGGVLIPGKNEIIGVARDITDQKTAEEVRKKLEAQLIQAQKMEAIGQLAGGIAHDFNNILVPILSYSQLGMRMLSADDKLYTYLEIIYEAAQRAANLTRQILAFSRKQVLDMRVLNLNVVVQDFTEMLQRLIGENIVLETILAPSLHQVIGDRGQLEQVLLNLAVNARDAMPSGGTLTLETANVALDAAYVAQHAEVQSPGPYVMLAVSDTGHGMDATTQQQIFDPFFTTKPRGKGTGLGLATVFGIIKQHQGSIHVYSEVDKGTIFKIYLPQAEGTVETLDTTAAAAVNFHGTETVLVFEDDVAVRNLVVETLTTHGYQVIEAQNIRDGLQRMAAHKEPIHLLLTDVVMPEMNGRELCQNVAAIHPDVKALYMSGYTNNIIAHHGVLDKGVNFLQKPFTVHSLLEKVREVLDLPNTANCIQS